MNFFNQCTALITGASSGLGAEFARQLAPFASTLILVARRADRLDALKQELNRPGLTIHCRKADLSSRTDLEELLKWLDCTGVQVNFLVNNAGLGDHGKFEASSWDRVREMLDVNIVALTKLTHALLPVLRKQPRAAILNVSSIASLMPIPKLAVYAATKAYVTSFSEALRAELYSSGVRVVALCPGPVPTEFGRVAERAANPEPMPAPEIFQVSAEKVVSDGLLAVERNCARVVPGWFVAFVMMMAAATPLFILRFAMRQQAKK